MSDRLWSYKRQGSGKPLVLLHGIGMSHQIWNQLIPSLAQKKSVIALDIAGFGKTPPLPNSILPTIPHLVDGLDKTLKGLGVSYPVDIVGHSLGGFMALEAAKRGMSDKVVVISPGGLWNKKCPIRVKYYLLFSYWIAQLLPIKGIELLLRSPQMREWVFRVPIGKGGRDISLNEAVRITKCIKNSTAFVQTMNVTGSFMKGNSIDAELIVVFGKEDKLLSSTSRNKNKLPSNTKWIENFSWGHTPMCTHPKEVTSFLLKTVK